MGKIVHFRPKAEHDAAANVAEFIRLCRDDLIVFGSDLPFDDHAWDITEHVDIKGKGRQRQRLIFSVLSALDSSEAAPLPELFQSFAKAYIRYMHGMRPVVGYGGRMAALRSLEAALAECGRTSSITDVDAGVFNRAAQIVDERYSKGAAYRIGGQLGLVAEFLSEHCMTTVPIRWRNPIQRPTDTVRVGKEHDERRSSKMPSPAALDALPKIFLLAREQMDVVTCCIAALMCCSPDRVNEVLRLPVDCEVTRKDSNGGEAYGLRWWPSKGAAPMIKWIVSSMADTAREALQKVRVVTEQARRVAKWYEDNPTQVHLDDRHKHLRHSEWIALDDLASVLGVVGSDSARVWCKKNHISVVKVDGVGCVRFSEIEKAVVAMLPAGFPILDRETGMKYSEALLVMRTNELHMTRGTCNCMIEPVTINQVNTGLGGRVVHGFESIFSRHGFTEPDGSPIKVTTHQFRHYLNTCAQIGGLSQLDIAKWSGRKDVRQNAAYDHTTADQMLQAIRDSLGDDAQMFGPLAELPNKPLIPRDEFAQLRVPTAHTTEFGFCIHDFTMSPCQQHMDCIHCDDLVCVKGDQEKERRLRQQLSEARDLLEQARQAKAQEYFGSDRWLNHHASTVERLEQLCSIMGNSDVPDGAVIRLSAARKPQQITAPAGRLSSGTKGEHASAYAELAVDED